MLEISRSEDDIHSILSQVCVEDDISLLRRTTIRQVHD